jgi:protein-tyrosine kinase
MGKFFKALEQAERERSLRAAALRRATPGESAPAVPAPPREEPAPAPTVPTRQPAVQESEPVPAGSVFSRPTVKKRVPSQPPTRKISTIIREVSAGLHGTVAERLVSLLTPSSSGAEQYRALRHKVEELHRHANLTVVGVSSPEPGDGKTITAINLAGALAQSPEARVLIVDADLRRSSLSECLGLDDSRARGLVGAILDSQLSLKDVVEPCPPFNLSVIQTGRRPSSPYEILKSPRLAQVLDEARQQYDYVILDMPPLVPLPDCRVISPSVDGFLVVVAAHKTHEKVLKEALSVLDPTAVIGLVFNADDQSPAGYYGRAGRSFRRGRSTVSDEAR